MYYVYMLTNQHNTVLYIGVTNNIMRRLQEHRRGEGRAFTAQYKLTKVVYLETSESIMAAIEREKQLKHWSRTKKDALINAKNPQWKDLSLQW
ncbi:GIY-YIG nuclease family protein [Bifidobacterium aquikefiri]|uniref:Excinuclease ABC subunit C n=2 Tax=Bifidobacterium aquikefiri TaxID=1653207 RepID=A0A261G736_9BIFI|nr:GIY-YIG nuclease family protein [Bifidobacterium aquikefiri]OZG67003.1 excinuclease ABC subunit C [Bifidobacterium aquikefiri]